MRSVEGNVKKLLGKCTIAKDREDTDFGTNTTIVFKTTEETVICKWEGSSEYYGTEVDIHYLDKYSRDYVKQIMDQYGWSNRMTTDKTNIAVFADYLAEQGDLREENVRRINDKGAH